MFNVFDAAGVTGIAALGASSAAFYWSRRPQKAKPKIIWFNDPANYDAKLQEIERNRSEALQSAASPEEIDNINTHWDEQSSLVKLRKRAK